MFVLNNRKMPYKYTSVTADDNCICVRVFSPTVCRAAERRADIDRVLTTEAIKGNCIVFENWCSVVCAHEVHLNRESPLWQGGNHLVFYTTPDLFINNIIAVSRKEDVQNLPAVTVLAEVLCASKEQKCCQADFMLYADPKASLFTNLFRDETFVGDFGFKTGLEAPMTIKTNQVFGVRMTMTDASGNPVDGEVIVNVLSGYVPNRVVKLVNGYGEFNCASLFVADKVVVKVCDLLLTVGVVNE